MQEEPMRTYKLHPLVALCLLALLATVAGCIPPTQTSGSLLGPRVVGSGKAATRNYDITDFDSLRVTSGFQVEVKSGAQYAVAVTADDNLFDHLNIVKQGSQLSFGLLPNRSVTSTTLRATVTMPTLVGANVSGGARLTFPAFTVDSFSAEASGGANLQGAVEAANNVQVRQSGGAQVSLLGTAGSLNVDGSGGGTMDLSRLAVSGGATCSMSGGTRASVSVKGTLSYDLSGGAHLDYSGNPQLGQQKTSGGASATAK
jgi:hypothetical protein